LGTSAGGLEVSGNMGLGYWKFENCCGIRSVLEHGARNFEVWKKSAEALKHFEKTGLGNWKFGKKCSRIRSV
jgi:hypothetical protein